MKSFAVCTLALLLVASGVTAGTVTADFISVDPGIRGTIYGYSSDPGMGFPGGVRTKAGVFNFVVNEINGSTAPGIDPESGLQVGQAFRAFDLELQFVNPGSNEYLVDALEAAPVGASPGPAPGDTMGAIRAGRLRKLWHKVSTLTGESPLDFTDPRSAAAFQLAAWAIVYDPVGTPPVDPNVTDPHTSADPGFWSTGFSNTSFGDARTLANSWLTGLDGYTDMEFGIMALIDTESQDFMFIGPGLPPTGLVPLPGAAFMGIVLLGGLAAVRSRRRRRN